MPKLKLTVELVDDWPPGAEPLILWDAALQGFGVLVRPSGRKTWIVQYRVGGGRRGRQRRFSLGTAPPVRLAEARKRARQMLSDAAGGEDPAEQRDQARAGATVLDVCDAYVDHLSRKRKTRTRLEVERVLAKRVAPTLGRRVAASVTREDVAALHRKIGESAPVEANRVLSYLRAAWNIAEDASIVPTGSNPVRRIERFRETKRERFLGALELERLGQALADAEAAGDEMPTAILALRLLVLTGMRKSEVLNLRWRDIDRERGLVMLEDSKTGRQTRPLTSAVVELIDAATRMEGNPYVCWGLREGRPLVGLQAAWSRIRAAAGLEDVRVHDLRHSFASVAAGHGTGLYIIGKLLGHADQATTQRYAHLDADPVQAAAETTAASVAARLRGEK